MINYLSSRECWISSINTSSCSIVFVWIVSCPARPHTFNHQCFA